MCDGEVTQRSQFLKPVLVWQCRGRAHWIIFFALTTAPAWRGQKLERKVQTGPGNEPLWLEGKAKLRDLSSLSSHSESEVAGKV